MQKAFPYFTWTQLSYTVIASTMAAIYTYFSEKSQGQERARLCKADPQINWYQDVRSLYHYTIWKPHNMWGLQDYQISIHCTILF